MGGWGSFAGNRSNNSQRNDSSFNQDVWSGQGSALTDMYNQAGNLYSGNAGSMQSQNDFGQQYSADVMNDQRTAANNATQGGVYQNMDLQNSLMDSLNQSNNNPSATQDINSMIMGGDGNNYADAMKQTYIDDANSAQQLMLGNLDARASASGMSGGARQGVVQAQGMDDINSNLQNQLATTGYDTFDKDLDRKLNIAQQADSNTLSRQQLTSDMLNNQQNTQNTGMQYGQNLYNQGNSTQMTPWNQTNAYSNSIGSPTVLGSGNSSGYGQGSSWGASTAGGGSFGGGK